MLVPLLAALTNLVSRISICISEGNWYELANRVCRSVYARYSLMWYYVQHDLWIASVRCLNPDNGSAARHPGCRRRLEMASTRKERFRVAEYRKIIIGSFQSRQRSGVHRLTDYHRTLVDFSCKHHVVDRRKAHDSGEHDRAPVEVGSGHWVFRRDDCKKHEVKSVE
jgi:hypothetical protein